MERVFWELAADLDPYWQELKYERLQAKVARLRELVKADREPPRDLQDGPGLRPPVRSS